MRIVFIGAGSVAVEATKELVQAGHDVIMIENDKTRIDQISEGLDCGLLYGDGCNPEILREAYPEGTDVLFSLTKNDQVNILSSLIAKTLGFKRVITSIADSEYETICKELGLKNVIVPVRTISQHLQTIVSEIEQLDN